jgi:hypothetical protein
VVTTNGNGEWDAVRQFHGPEEAPKVSPPAPPSGLTPWEQYAQVLLAANEFAFVD